MLFNSNFRNPDKEILNRALGAALRGPGANPDAAIPDARSFHPEIQQGLNIQRNNLLQNQQMEDRNQLSPQISTEQLQVIENIGTEILKRAQTDEQVNALYQRALPRLKASLPDVPLPREISKIQLANVIVGTREALQATMATGDPGEISVAKNNPLDVPQEAPQQVQPNVIQAPPSEATPPITFGPQDPVGQAAVENLEQAYPVEVPPAEQPDKLTPTKTSLPSASSPRKVQNNLDLTSTQKTRMQDKLVLADEGMANMTQIADNWDPTLFSYEGKMSSMYKSVTKKLGYEDPKRDEWLSKRKEFNDMIQKGFLAYRKLITGVAGPPKDYKTIEDATLSKNNDEASARGAATGLMKAFLRDSILTKDLLQHGFNAKTPGAGQQVETQRESVGGAIDQYVNAIKNSPQNKDKKVGDMEAISALIKGINNGGVYKGLNDHLAPPPPEVPEVPEIVEEEDPQSPGLLKKGL